MSNQNTQEKKPPLPPLSKKKPIKPISLKLTQRAALDWGVVRNYVSNRTGMKANNVDVAIELIRAFKDRKQLIEDLRVSESKLRKKDDEIFQLLKESINRPINIQVGAQALAQTTQQQFIPPRPVREIKGLSTQKKDLLIEMREKFIPENCENGQLLPSKIKEGEEDE